MIGLKLVINLLTILIESKWNLKLTYETFSLIDILHINRIKVEFKVVTFTSVPSGFFHINRIKVEFKVTKQRDYMIAELHINRIKVEFKGPM